VRDGTRQHWAWKYLSLEMAAGPIISRLAQAVSHLSGTVPVKPGLLLQTLAAAGEKVESNMI
jgi:hypothetical protein